MKFICQDLATQLSVTRTNTGDSQLLKRKRLFWFIVFSVSVGERWVRGLRWDSALWKGVCSGVNLKLHASMQREEDQARKALAISMLQWPADILEGTLSEDCTTQQQHHAEDQHLFLVKRCVLPFITCMCQSVYTDACGVHRSQKKTPDVLLWISRLLSHLLRYCHQNWVLLPLSHLSSPLNHS